MKDFRKSKYFSSVTGATISGPLKSFVPAESTASQFLILANPIPFFVARSRNAMMSCVRVFAASVVIADKQIVSRMYSAKPWVKVADLICVSDDGGSCSPIGWLPIIEDCRI